MIAHNLSLLILASASASALPFASSKSLRQPTKDIHVEGHRSEDTEEEEHHLITSSGGKPEARVVNQGHRDLPAAGWEKWPSDLFRNLNIVHSLCGKWVDVLEEVAEVWEDVANNANAGMTISLESEGCNYNSNSDLTYIDDVIHVVYGSCGGCSNCGGKADVEYGWDSYPGPVTDYAVLVRVDKKCVNEDDYQGMKYILCHEIGHALGLGHNDDSDSCLGPWSDDSDSSTPGEEDAEVLEDLYGGSSGNNGGGSDNNNGCYEFELTLETDKYGSETSWQVTDDSNNKVVAQGSGYSSGRNYQETECLDENESYTFTIEDSYGDGICCSHGKGSYVIKYGEQTIQSGGEFDYSESATLGAAARPGINTCKKFILYLQTDGWGSETSWAVMDSNNNVFAQGSGYSANTVYAEESCLEDNKAYTFTIEDSWGDGIVGDGYYELNFDGELIHKGGDFDFSETVAFGA